MGNITNENISKVVRAIPRKAVSFRQSLRVGHDVVKIGCNKIFQNILNYAVLRV